MIAPLCSYPLPVELVDENDGDIEDILDEDLRNDPISQIDMRVCLHLSSLLESD